MKIIMDIIIVWFMILVVVSFIPATLIGVTFSFCYRKTLSSKKAIVYSTFFAPVITFIYLISPFFQISASLANYLFFPLFAFCFTPLIAAFRLKRIKSFQKEGALKKTYWIVDIFYFVALSTILGSIWYIIFGRSTPFGIVL